MRKTQRILSEMCQKSTANTPEQIALRRPLVETINKHAQKAGELAYELDYIKHYGQKYVPAAWIAERQEKKAKMAQLATKITKLQSEKYKNSLPDLFKQLQRSPTNENLKKKYEEAVAELRKLELEKHLLTHPKKNA